MIIETERLLLLSPEKVKVESLVEFLSRNRKFAEVYEPRREEAYFSVSFQKNLLRQQTEDWEGGRGYRFYLSPKDHEKIIIGFTALNNVVMGAFCSCYLGYRLDQNWLNRGLMTEAVEAVTAFAFQTLGLHRVEGNIMPGNLPSIRVVEKCGFVKEGISRQYLKINGVWEDHVHYVKLNEEIKGGFLGC